MILKIMKSYKNIFTCTFYRIRSGEQRRRVERQMRAIEVKSVLEVLACSQSQGDRIKKILEGKVVGERIVHVWDDDDNKPVTWSGRIIKFNHNEYDIVYWPLDGWSVKMMRRML